MANPKRELCSPIGGRNLLVVTITVLVVAVGWQAIQQQQQRARIAGLEAAATRIDEALQPPQGWEAWLKRLEDRVADPNAWPKDVDEATAFMSQVQVLASQLAPWAGRQHLTRVEALEWSAQAFSAMNATTRESDDESSGLPDTIMSLIETSPLGSPPHLLVRLRERLTEERQRAWNILIGQLESDLKKGQDLTLERLESDAARLTEFDTIQEFAKDAGRFRGELQRRGQQLVRQELAQSMARRAEMLEAMRDRDPALYELGLSVLLGEIRTSRMNLAWEGVGLESLDSLDRKLTASSEEVQSRAFQKQETERSKALQEYQQFALRNIQWFEYWFQNESQMVESVKQQISEGNRDASAFTALPSVRRAIEKGEYQKIERRFWLDGEKYSLAGEEGDLSSQLKHWICRDAMVAYLLPINLNLLELPVQECFQKSWQKGWMQLEGRKDQTWVAEKTVSVEKRALMHVNGATQ